MRRVAGDACEHGAPTHQPQGHLRDVRRERRSEFPGAVQGRWGKGLCFIRGGQVTHTALQTPDFYESASGVPLFDWLDDFLKRKPFWVDIVEDIPAP